MNPKKRRNLGHYHVACMLGTQLNKLIEKNSMKENSIIRVDRVMVNAIDKQNGR